MLFGIWVFVNPDTWTRPSSARSRPLTRLRNILKITGGLQIHVQWDGPVFYDKALKLEGEAGFSMYKNIRRIYTYDMLDNVVKTIFIGFLWLVGFSLANAEEIIKAPSAEDEKAVVSSARTFVLTLDAGKYDASWMQFAPEIQKTLVKLSYVTSIGVMRLGLGDIKERKPIGLKFIKDLKGVPPGSYAALFWASDFQRVSGQEKVILMKSQGKWLIVGYFFEKNFKFNQ